MKNSLLVLTMVAICLSVTSCSSDKVFEKQLQNSLEKNPDILLSAMEKHPEKFMQTFQKMAMAAKENSQKDQALLIQKEIEHFIENPLKPEIERTTNIRGPESAPITIVEYSDFECPYCSRGQQTVSKIMDKYPGKVRFVYKHLPLSFHPNAMISAKYFEAISLQSPQKAFKFHDKLFSNQSKLKLGESYLTQISKDLGVDINRLKEDLHSPKVQAIIDRDLAEAKKFNIQGTPGFVLNGIPIKGAYPAEHFEQIISKLIEKKKIQL